MYYSKWKLSHTCAAFNRIAVYSLLIIPLGRWEWCLTLPGFSRSHLLAIHLDGQQRATSYQAKKLQEDEVIDEQDAVGKERPPHVTQGLGLVNACGEETLVSENQQRNSEWLFSPFPVMKLKQKTQNVKKRNAKTWRTTPYTLDKLTWLDYILKEFSESGCKELPGSALRPAHAVVSSPWNIL